MADFPAPLFNLIRRQVVADLMDGDDGGALTMDKKQLADKVAETVCWVFDSDEGRYQHLVDTVGFVHRLDAQSADGSEEDS